MDAQAHTPRLGHVCGTRLAEIADSQRELWVLDGDLANSDGADAFAHCHPARFLNVGIAEQTIVSVAAGMAACGLKPWVFSFAAFLCCRAYDQIRVCVSQTHLPVAFIGSHAGGLSNRNGKSHTVLNDIALMATLPGISVWTPADAQDAVFCIDQISATPQSAYVRLPRELVAPIGGTPAAVRWIGKPARHAILSAGLSTHWATQAAALLCNWGTDIGVLHFCQVWPLHMAPLRELLKPVEWAFVLEDHYGLGGLASLLPGLDRPLRITSLAWPSHWSGQSGNPADVLRMFALDPAGIAQRISVALYPRAGEAPVA